MNKTCVLFFLTGILAHFLVLQEYLVRMWSLAHYQFFPIAVGCAIWLLWSRRGELLNGDKKPGVTTQTVLFSVVLVTILFATLINSSFLGWISFLLFLAASFYSIAGGQSLRAAAPALFALGLITPLPGQLDQALILSMQSLASQLASWILDSVGLLHFRQGVVLVSETDNFLAEEACSGIRSLFSGIFAIAFWGLLHRYSWWRHLINLIQVIGWVLSVNALRIASVVFIEDRTSFSVAKGLSHELLGLFAFLLIFGLAVSFDHLVKFFFPVSNEDEIDQVETVSVASSDRLQLLSIPHLRIWLTGFGIVGLVSIRLAFSVGGVSVATQALDRLFPPERSDLTVELAGWNVTDYRETKRTRDDIQGERSYIWELAANLKGAKLSVDCEWSDFHDLSYCYTGLGWKVQTEHYYDSMFTEDLAESGGALNYSRLTLTKPTGERGWVLFCGLDRNGGDVHPPVKLGQNTVVHLWEKINNSLRLVVGLPEIESIRNTTFVGPVTTLQVLYIPTGLAGEEQEEVVEPLFLAAREQLRKSKRFAE